MNLKKSLSLTRISVFVGIFCSIGSIFTVNNIYPFCTYKLYTQPLGSKNTYTEYRIYSRVSLKEDFKRNPIKETSSYDYDSYYYILNYLINEIKKEDGNQDDNKKKLLLFAKHILPGQTEYKIVSETYQPLDLIKENIKYDTATVLTF